MNIKAECPESFDVEYNDEENIFEWEWYCRECGQGHISYTTGADAETVCDECEARVSLKIDVN